MGRRGEGGGAGWAAEAEEVLWGPKVGGVTDGGTQRIAAEQESER